MRWTVLAWSLFGLFAAFVVATVALGIGGFANGDQAFVLLSSGYGLVGAMVASREPRNAVGWLMLAVALSLSITGFTDAYITGSHRPGEEWAAWVSGWAWNIWLFVPIGILPFLFPDGRVVSPRWRYALGLAVLGLAGSIAVPMLQAGALNVQTPGTITNPLGVAALTPALVSHLTGIGDLVGVTIFVLAAASLVLRLRKSRGRAREQVKWFVYVGAVAIMGIVLASLDGILEHLVGEPTPQWSQLVGGVGWVTTALSLLVGLPAAIGVAILRHHLYGIDLVINRTLVYGALSVLLAATYFALVVGLRFLLRPVTGESDLAVAASTLAVAALFRPLRVRVQRVVDRRFFRSHYDTELTLEDFAAQLRNELDLDSLGTDLRDVVSSTMHPEHVTLWLRSAS